MDELVVVALAGFLAAFVDGSLGMGFGPTSSSILLSSGLSPVSVSATVNIAKVATGVVGGAAHWRFGNVDRRIVLRLAVPGVFGALGGTLILTNIDGDRLRPILAALLFLIGLRILLRFRRPVTSAPPSGGRHAHDLRGVTAAGAVGGVTNGMIGAWGPVVTPFLLHRGVIPRLVVGSVNTAEIAVAVVAAGSLLTADQHSLDASTVVAMLVGGVLAAPVAALTVRRVPARLLGVLVAGLLLLTNARELATWAELGWMIRWAIYAAIGAIVVVVAWPSRTPPIESVVATPDTSVATDSRSG